MTCRLGCPLPIDAKRAPRLHHASRWYGTGNGDGEATTMATRTSAAQGILSPDRADKRDEIIELLKTAYWMELETVMSYIANSVNPDGVRAQEIREALEEDIQE